jgi:hypothetical protein
MRLNPTVDEDWSAWERKQYLLNRLGRSSEEAQKRYRALLEIAAGALPTQDNATLSPPQRQLLVDKIYYDEGSLDEQEHWPKVVERWESDNDVYEMEASTHGMVARRLAERLREECGSPPTREHMVALVQRIMTAAGAEEEQAVWLLLRAEETDASQGSMTDDTYWPKQEMSAEEIVDHAIERGKRN